MSAAVSLPPSMVRIVRQSGQDSDCGVSALGMFLGLRENEALAACALVAPAVLTEGMSWREVKEVAQMVGVSVRLRKRYALDEDTGVLGLSAKGKHLDHFVFLWAGRIIDGNTEMWLDPDEYLAHYKYRAGSLLVRDE